MPFQEILGTQPKQSLWVDAYGAEMPLVTSIQEAYPDGPFVCEGKECILISRFHVTGKRRIDNKLTDEQVEFYHYITTEDGVAVEIRSPAARLLP